MYRRQRIGRTAMVLGALAIMGFGMASGCGQAADETTPNSSASLAPVVTACHADKAADGSGSTVVFSSQLVDKAAGTFTLESTVQKSTVASSIIVKLNGNPLYQMQSSTAANGTATRIEKYFAPIAGVREVVTTTDGKTMSSVMDGRRTIAVPLGTEASRIRFEDGKPVPETIMSEPIRAAFKTLLEAASKDSVACLSTASSTAVETNKSPLELGHPSGSSGSACTGCELGCYAEQFACAAGAAACGPFAPVCAAICIYHTQTCLSDCHRSGTDCCPVGCGGESEITTPIGGCCLQGETCLRRATDEHVALCCSPGTAICGDSSCCNSSESCVPAGGGVPAYCCPSTWMRNGHCCSSGVCNSRADCNGGDPNGPNGCDVSGCCYPG